MANLCQGKRRTERMLRGTGEGGRLTGGTSPVPWRPVSRGEENLRGEGGRRGREGGGRAARQRRGGRPPLRRGTGQRRAGRGLRPARKRRGAAAAAALALVPVAVPSRREDAGGARGAGGQAVQAAEEFR